MDSPATMVPLAWVMAIGGFVGTVIGTLFGLYSKAMNDRIAAEVAGRAAAEKGLADERKERLSFVTDLFADERDARRDLQSIVDDHETMARSQERGAFRGSRPEIPPPATGAHRIRGGGGAGGGGTR